MDKRFHVGAKFQFKDTEKVALMVKSKDVIVGKTYRLDGFDGEDFFFIDEANELDYAVTPDATFLKEGIDYEFEAG